MFGLVWDPDGAVGGLITCADCAHQIGIKEWEPWGSHGERVIEGPERARDEVSREAWEVDCEEEG